MECLQHLVDTERMVFRPAAACWRARLCGVNPDAQGPVADSLTAAACAEFARLRAAAWSHWSR